MCYEIGLRIMEWSFAEFNGNNISFYVAGLYMYFKLSTKKEDSYPVAFEAPKTSRTCF